MTEEEWLECDRFRLMLSHLDAKVSRRKVLLYVCAGLRTIWKLLYAESSRLAVEVAERAADGAATEDEVAYASGCAEGSAYGHAFVADYIRRYPGDSDFSQDVKSLMAMGVFTEADVLQAEQSGDRTLGDESVVARLINASHIAYHGTSSGNLGLTGGGLSEHLLDHLEDQTEWPGGWLVREVFGNPFRPVTFPPSWLTSTVVALAEAIYADRTFDRLLILADALQDAGCEDAAVLAHCRGDGPHVRGCWVVDGVLGKN